MLLFVSKINKLTWLNEGYNQYRRNNNLCKINMEQYIVSVPQAWTFELGQIEIEINQWNCYSFENGITLNTYIL